MVSLYVLQAGRNEWNDERRIDSAVGVPLDEAGARAARELTRQLGGRDIRAVYAAHSESPRQTARIVAAELKCKAHHRSGLGELDFGLWQGLLVREVKQRYARAYRQWRSGGDDAGPPGGETFVQAQRRIRSEVGRILKRHRDQSVLLVLEPVAAGLLKCHFEGRDLARVCEQIDWSGAWAYYELEAATAPRSDA